MAGHDFKEALIAEIERAVREREDSLRVPRHVLLITLRRWAGSQGADGKTLERALSELCSEGARGHRADNQRHLHRFKRGG